MRADRVCVIFVVSAFALIGAAGCAGSIHHPSDADREGWLAAHGGTVEGAVAERARAAARSVLVAYPTVRLRVLDVDRPAAFSWPDGTVVVSRGLLAALSEDELCACVAHELGHLIGDGWLNPPAALTGAGAGGRGGIDAERRADAIAVQVLAERGLPVQALARALRKVAEADHGLSGSERCSLQARIEQIEKLPPPLKGS